MSKNIKIKLEGVQETLLIPLVARAKETQRKKPRIEDRKAVEILSKIECDTDKYDGGMSYQGVVARTMILDRETQKFVDKNPNAICISIGCGLDTRYHRIKHSKITWYNLDFPEVIDLRKQLLFEGKNVKYIAKSALDISWVDEVEYNGEPVLILLEGLLMYFTEAEVMQLLCMLKNHFLNCRILAEIMHPFVAGRTKNHDTVKKTNASFHWGIKSGKEMEVLCEGLKFKQEWNLFDELKNQGIGYRISAAIPFIRNKHNKIVELSFNEEKNAD